MDLQWIVDAYQWAVANPLFVAEVAGIIWTAISVLVAITPTKADDRALSRGRAALERASFLQPKNSPGIISVPGAKARRPE